MFHVPNQTAHEFDPRKGIVWIVDDDPIICEVASLYLRENGFEAIRTFETGKGCVCALEHELLPDLLILDLHLPDISGYDLLEIIRSNSRLAELPVLVATGEKKADARNKAVTLGASSLISKPFDADLLYERATNLIKIHWLSQELAQFRSRMTEELDIAKSLQASLLPSNELLAKATATSNVSVQHLEQSSSELSGDFWGIKDFQPGVLTLYSVDVSGHGVAAAASTFRLHEIIESEPLVDGNLVDFMQRINARFVARTPTEVFASFVICTIDTHANLLTYASAMAPPPFLLKRQNQEPVALPSAALPLGISKSPHYYVHEELFEPGDYLLLYSDALTESRDGTDHMLGGEIPGALLKGARSSKGRIDLDNISREFFALTGPALEDDLTLLLIGRPE